MAMNMIPPPILIGRLEDDRGKQVSDARNGWREGAARDSQSNGRHDRRDTPILLHNVGEIVLHAVPPKVRDQADDHEDGDILDPPDRTGDQGGALVHAGFPPEEEGEEDQADDEAYDGLRSGPAGSGIFSWMLTGHGVEYETRLDPTHHPALSPPSVKPKIANTAAATIKNVPT